MRYSTSLALSSLWVTLTSTCLLAVAARGTEPSPGDCVPRHKSLVAWWRAEGSAADQFGMHGGETPFGIAYANGVVGQAFDFDGTGRRVSVPDSPDFKLVNAMTLEAWVYPRAYQGFITFRGDSRGGLDTWTLDAYESGHVKFTIIDETNGFARVLAPLALNQWQHVAATWDRDSGDMRLFVNGTLAAQTNTTIVPIGDLDTEAAVGIGNHGGTFHQFPFNGLIDELGIYSRALSSNEIVAIWQAGSAGKCVTNPPPPDPITVINGPVTNQANGNLYYLLSSTTWTLSETTAISMGGHLVTLNDAAENAWVVSTFGNDGKALWIGLNDIETEGNHVWSSGETSAFRNWSPGEPNNHHGWEDLAYIVETDPGYPLMPGQWADTTDTGFNPGSGEGVNHPLHGVVEVPGDIPPPTNPPCPPTTGLVAYYPFTGNADDQSGNGNHGMVINATLTNDLPGTPLQAMTFAGDGVIDCGNGGAFQFRQSDFTLSLLVKTPSNTSGPFKCLLTKDRCYQQGSQFRLETRAGMIAFGLTDRTGAQFGTWTGGWWRLRAPLPAGTWSHVTVVREGVELRLYVNGELGSAFSMSGSPDHQSANNFLIGARYGCSATYGDFFTGELDEVRVYQRALDPEEIQTVFLYDTQGVCPTNPPPPVNLLVNGSFEEPPGIAHYQTVGVGTGIPGWVIESGTVDHVGLDWIAADGLQCLDLNGVFEQIGTLYQDVPTTPGQAYRVRFAYAGNFFCGPVVKTTRVTWDGSLVEEVSFDTTGHSETNLGWTYFEYTVLASNTTSRLRFQSTTSTFCGPALDDVSVTPMETPPAPIVIVPQQPTLRAFAPQGSDPLRLEFAGVSGITHAVQASTNLVDWVTIGLATEVESGQFVFEDAETPSQPYRFYRIVKP